MNLHVTNIVLLLFLSDALWALSWVPQLGTPEHPKLPELSHSIHRGQIAKFGNDYYKAMRSGIISELPSPGTDTNSWRKVTKGSFQLPKTVDVDQITDVGEIFKDAKSESYYKSTCVSDMKTQRDCLKEFNYKENWMLLSRQDIGDIRLGDLAIPGSHDTGTDGIDENSFLIDQFFLFSLAELVAPNVIVNWSLTQDTNVSMQLQHGMRHLDLRVADCQSLNDTFRWWHGMSSGVIDGDLQDLGEFARTHPQEIILLKFQHFVSPGNAIQGTFPISPRRKTELSDMFLQYLGDQMVPYGVVSENPTVNEVLATGRNIIAMMEDDAIRDKSELYWPFNFVRQHWRGMTNPEDLFNERSEALKDFLINNSEQLTDISGCFTPDEKTITGAMLRVYGDNPIIEDILERLAPGLNDLEPDMMSFEGVFIDLLNSARYGINNDGMYVRHEDYYSNGVSVHYRGMNDMYKYWLARPTLFKPNILYVDDVYSSDIVTTSVMANLGQVPREAAISFQGNSRNGFYFFHNFTGYGGEEGLECTNVDARFTVVSKEFKLHQTFSDVQEIVFVEGQYPPDASVIVEVTSPGSDTWHELISFNIDDNIQEAADYYIRGDDLGGGNGFAYVSTNYNHFGDACGIPPSGEYVNIVTW